MIQPKMMEQPQPRRPARFTGMTPKRRRARARFARNWNSMRVVVIIALVFAPVISYVWLTSHITDLAFNITHKTAERAQLLEEAQQLDDRIAHLESRDRLAVIATKLGMRDPDKYAVVSAPQPEARPKNGGLAFLEWFKRP